MSPFQGYEIFYVSLSQGVALGYSILPFQDIVIR